MATGNDKLISVYGPLKLLSFDHTINRWIKHTTCPGIKLESDVPEQLTLMQYNLMLTQYYDDFRIAKFIELVQQHQPHIITLQEITVSLRKLLLSQPEIQQKYYVCYKYFKGDSNERRHGLMTLTQYPPLSAKLFKLHSNSKRTTIITWLKLNRESHHTLAIANFHLESPIKATGLRKNQLQFIQKKLQNTTLAIMMGDSNMMSDTENNTLTDKYKDMFIELQRNDKIPFSELGLTFDLISNKMGKLICGWVQQSRLDRIFISDETISPLHLSVIGDQPFKMGKKNIWISDHFGLLGQINLSITK